MKKPNNLDYSDTPGIKISLKLLTKSVIRKLYLSSYRLRVDKTIVNTKGIKGLALVASYTDNDKGYLDGLIASSEAFEKIILYHDTSKHHDFAFNESIRFQQLVSAAKRNGAQWVLIGSPKTRFSEEFRKQIEPYIKEFSGTPTVLSLRERYLWNNFDQYASPKIVDDEIVIEKLFAITDDMVFDNKMIHASQRPINYKNVVSTTASRYYIGRFNLEMMKKKAEFYHKKDGKDYSYLSDMAKPKKHGETILGIGDYERKELIG